MAAKKHLHIAKVSAPGKVILHGEHAVVFGKIAIAASLGLRSSAVLQENDNPDLVLLFRMPAVGVEKKFSIKTILEKLSKSAPTCWQKPTEINHDTHIKNIDEFLAADRNFESLKSNQKNTCRGTLYLFSGIFANRNVELKSIDVTVTTELTIGAGTGSSASYAVVLAGSLIRLLRMKKGESLEKDFTTEEKSIINDWAFNCEKIMHGTPSGIDNATCTFGSVVSFRSGSPPRLLTLRLGMRILLVDTRVQRQTKVLAAGVRALRHRNEAAVDHVMQAIEEVVHSATRVLENLSRSSGKDSDDDQYDHLAELWNMNHCLLASLGVSHPALERIRTAAAAQGLAAKLTGAGGGGYAIILIPPSTKPSTLDALRAELERDFTVTETSLAGPGVCVE